MANSGGRSALGAVGASGLTRVGMRAGRAMAAEILDRHDYSTDGSLRLLEAFAPSTGGRWLADHPDVTLRPPRGHVFAVRRSQYQGLAIDVPDTAFNRYDDQQQGALFDVIEVAEDVRSVQRGDVVVALSFAGRSLSALAPGLVSLRAPEVQCTASERMLSSDVVYEKDVRDQFSILERLPGGKCRVQRAPNSHRTPRGRVDGCVCGGEIAAILTSDTSNTETDRPGFAGRG